VGVTPDPRKKTFCFGTGENKGDTVTVEGQAREPMFGFITVGRVKPDATVPGFSQAVVNFRVVYLGSIPRSVNRRARVKVKGSQGAKDFWWGKPVFLASGSDIKVSHDYFFSWSSRCHGSIVADFQQIIS